LSVDEPGGDFYRQHISKQQTIERRGRLTRNPQDNGRKTMAQPGLEAFVLRASERPIWLDDAAAATGRSLRGRTEALEFPAVPLGIATVMP
jgi:hypothetical protein